MTQEMYRQGDLLILKVNKIPRKKKLKRVEDKIILRGEATGHAHKLVGGELFGRFSGRGYEMFIEVPTSGKVVHEEHDQIILPKGSYHVIRQREYTPWSKEGISHIFD